MEGTVSSFLPGKGYGFVHGDDGRDYFAHANDIAGQQVVIEGQRVSFEEAATPKGYRARCVHLMAMAGPTRYHVPTEVVLTRGGNVNGNEVLVRSHWIVKGSSRHSPDAAKRDLKEHVRRMGANAVLDMEYSKSTGANGNYRFTIHHFSGHAVVVGRASTSGAHDHQAIAAISLDGRAATLKHRMDKRRSLARWMIGVVLVFAALAEAGLWAARAPATDFSAWHQTAIVGGVVVLIATVAIVNVVWALMTRDTGWLRRDAL